MPRTPAPVASGLPNAPEGTTSRADGDRSTCDELVRAGVAHARANDLAAAERDLTRALGCPGGAAATELAGVRLLQRRWTEVDVLASAAIGANPSDAYAWKLLGTARFVRNDPTGALDAWITPIQMKKGRPGMTLSALCPVTAADRLGAVLLRETSSLGYRKLPATRGERPRRFIEVPTPYGLIPVKVGSGPWGSPQIKPEFDVCAARAREHGVAVRDVVQVALVMARQELGEL